MHQRQTVLIPILILSVACGEAARSPTGVESNPANPSTVNDTSKDTSQISRPDTSQTVSQSPSASTVECPTMKPGWLFCDDFEVNRLSQYFEYSNPNSSFTRTDGVGLGGSTGMRATFASGQSDAGALKLAFGKTPDPYIRPVDDGTKVYRELYWRMYVKNDSTWTGGGGDKLSRAQSLVNSQWAQAMVAPIWSGNSASSAKNYLYMDPATGVSGDSVMETTYNDFTHQQYLGARQSIIPIFDAAHVGQWYCVEAHVKLNDAGQLNGTFEFWINGQLQASRSDVNWVGSYTAYGINAVFFENYWNNGSPKVQSRYIDNIVVSTEQIGCLP